ncbi:protein trichome birefringence-like 34 [Andrographis paniculata]|uniref:protein trichome birefringence-like 34 n=1 Tax=Andrographis paniculata TaxID=175694 RepID=UPI0021E93404|nr:protein trichome birefringence-like 34 [Andrographis paniculata]
MNLETRKVGFKSYYLVVFFLAALAAVALLTLDNGSGIVEKRNMGVAANNKAKAESNEEKIIELVSECNLFSGRWVFGKASSSSSSSSYPPYEEGQCSYMTPEFACQRNGRPDSKYQGWKWQPRGCDLPRFNGTALMEALRGKRLVFVGDSLNRNQWVSMLCLIESSSSLRHSTVIRDGNQFTFHAPEYNSTIDFYWSPLLVESNCDDPMEHKVKQRIVKIKAIEKHGRHWTDADILVFDSFIWWLQPSMTILWGGSFSPGSSDASYKQVVEGMEKRVYEMALDTWSDWVEFNVNRTRTKMFFMSLSPMHPYGESLDVLQHCYNETEPTLEEDGYRGRRRVETFPDDFGLIAQSAIQKLARRGVRVEYLNITHLSDYRKDAHPSIYTYDFQKEADPRKRSRHSDCGHWCLPGVPDVWNQILYSYIINSSS